MSVSIDWPWPCLVDTLQERMLTTGSQHRVFPREYKDDAVKLASIFMGRPGTVVTASRASCSFDFRSGV